MFLESVSRERALEFRDYVVAREPYRLAMLLQVLESTGGPVEVFDGTLASLGPVWRWYMDFVDQEWPGIPDGVVPAVVEDLSGPNLTTDEERLRRRVVAQELLEHYLKLVVQTRDPSVFWDLYLQPGRVLEAMHQQTGLRLAGGEFVNLQVFVPNMTGKLLSPHAPRYSRDPDRLRDVLLMRCPAGWADVDQPRGRQALEEYREFVGAQLPEHVAVNPFARWAAEDAAAADGPGDAGGAEAFGAELTLAVGSAAGLEDPSGFAALPVAVVAEVLRSLDLTHEDGAPLRDEELMQDGLQLFDADGTAMVETVAGGALRALHVEPAGGGSAQRWDVIEGRLQALADRLGGHLVAVGPHDWPEP